MAVRTQAYGYRSFGVLHNAAIRTGVYAGVGLSVVFVSWVFVANRVDALQSVASERNLVGAVALGLFALVPVVRFLRCPGHLLASSLIAWSIFALTYRLLCMHFWGLAERYSAMQVFTLGVVLYLIVATALWLCTIIWRAVASRPTH